MINYLAHVSLQNIYSRTYHKKRDGLIGVRRARAAAAALLLSTK
jgi:hypothetical protein